MIIIDENFPDSQRQLLQGWRISFKQVAFEIGWEGLKDMGKVIRVSHNGLTVWKLHAEEKIQFTWS